MVTIDPRTQGFIFICALRCTHKETSKLSRVIYVVHIRDHLLRSMTGWKVDNDSSRHSCYAVVSAQLRCVKDAISRFYRRQTQTEDEDYDTSSVRQQLARFSTELDCLSNLVSDDQNLHTISELRNLLVESQEKLTAPDVVD